MSELMQEIRDGAGFGLISWAWDWWHGVCDRHAVPDSISGVGAIAIFFGIALTVFTPVNLLWILALILRVPYDFAVWAWNRRDGGSDGG